MKTFSSLFIFLVSLILIFNSCGNSGADTKNILTDAESRNYFSAYTQGMIYEDDEIEFRLLESKELNEEQVRNALKITPGFDYSLKIREDNKGFIIIPNANLERGKDYTIEILLNQILDLDDNKKLISKLKTFDQFVSVQREGLIIDQDNNHYIRIKVTTALSEIEEDIKSLFDYSKDKITLESVTGKDFIADILFDPSNRKKKISWDGKVIRAKENGSIDFWSFDQDEFRVVNTYFNRTSNEYQVYFSKLLDENQDAQGLIRLGKENAEFRIKNNQLTVRIKTKSKEDINLSVSQGLLAKDGSKLELDLAYKVEVAMVKPELEWIANGTYIPHTGQFKLPFKAKALKSVVASVVGIPSINASRFAAWNNMTYMDQMEMVRFGKLIYKTTYELEVATGSAMESWNEFGIDFTDAFEREKGMIYFVELSFGPSNTILSCDNQEIYDFEQETIDDSWFDDRNRYYRYYGYYDYREQNNPCHTAYYLSRPNISTMVHCTNVFPIIKKGENQVHVAVKELLDSHNAAGAKIDLIDLQGFDIANGEISALGVCSFNNLKRDAKAIRIKYQGEESYFNVQEGEENQITEFDISSNVQDIDNRIFVYTERDVRRPGDTIYLNIMLNRAKYHFEAGLPVVVRLKNPKNVLYSKYLAHVEDNRSIYTFHMPTRTDDLTGYWTADIDIGPLQKWKSLRLETIKPNVVDLVYTFNNASDDWIFDNQIEGRIDVQYLAGYPMKNGKVTASANILPIHNPFDNFGNFTFEPLDRTESAYDLKLWTITTNSNGQANISFNHDFKKYQGVSKLILDTSIDLPGGGLNTETESRLISPYESYVGIQKGQGRGWRGSYRYGEIPEFEVIQVDKAGKLKKQTSKVKAELFKYSTDWWYDRYRLTSGHRSQNSYRYDKVANIEIVLSGGKGKYTHDTKKNKSGMYKLVITDLQSGHVTEYQFHSIVASDYAVKTNPVFFDLELDKESYSLNESVKMKFPEIDDAKALVSVERGSEVLKYFWHDLSSETLSIPVDDSWFPNVFLHVSIVQNYGQQNNDRPMRMYTVKKIPINQPDKTLVPVIESSEKIAPNSTFEFEVKEDNGEPMEYTVAIVDRGLLNLTGFKTPNPLAHFSKMIALRVKTWDIFEQLLYYMNPSFAGVFSIGGDEATEKLLDESADFNRFEPVVYHLGPFTLDANRRNKHSVQLPNYIGSLKMTIIACNKSTFGSTERNIKVVSPLMVQSQLPRALNVGDVVDVPLTFFKDEERIKEVKTEAKVSNELVEFENPTLTTALQGNDQATESMRFITGKEAGITHINFESRSSGFEAIEETQLFINYPNSYSEQSEVLELNPGDEKVFKIQSFGYEKTKSSDLLISGALLPNFSQQYSNLISYPYGCLEQTTSKAIGLLYIQDLMELTREEKLKRDDYLGAAISKINSYQQKDGRFNYWQNGYYHAWSDLYAGHFLLDARDKNIMHADQPLSLWINHKKTQANQWEIQGTAQKYVVEREEMLQSYRLFLLAKAGTPMKSAMNRFRKRTLESRMAKVLLAGAYHYTGMKDISSKLLEEALREGDSDRYYNYSFGSDVRNKSLVIYIMSMINQGSDLDKLYRDWVSEINQAEWLSTQDQGFAFMACTAYYGNTQNLGQQVDFEVRSSKYNLKEKLPSEAHKRLQWDWQEMGDNVTIKNTGTSKLYIHKTERAISDEIYQEAIQSNLILGVKYTKLNGENIDKDNIRQGEEILIRITVHNNDILDQENLALTFKAPSGWEILNPRLYQTNADSEAQYTYQDFRDDKVYTFFDLSKNGKSEFKFRAKANLTGDFYLPAVRCENMYNGKVFAQNKASRVIIK